MARVVRFHKAGVPRFCKLTRWMSACRGPVNCACACMPSVSPAGMPCFAPADIWNTQFSPARIGQEAAGTVEAIGDGVTGSQSETRCQPYRASR